MRKRTSRCWTVIAAVIMAAALVAGFADVYAEKASDDAKRAYKEARRALNSDEYEDAAKLFESVYEKYPDSKYAAESLYWRAFALYRLGDKRDLEEARRALEKQFDEFGRADTNEDARALYYRVLGLLAEKGDSDAARKLAELSDKWAENDTRDDEEYDTGSKIAALHALINMKSERAVPILKKLYEDPGSGNAELREQALFLLSQHDTDESVELLMKIAKEDPDPEVRGQAIFWLSQTRSEKAVVFLEDLLQRSEDPEVQEKAIFALSQIGTERAIGILRKIVTNDDLRNETRGQAIFWLGQNGGLDDIEYLKQLFGRLDDRELKEKIMFAVSQNSGREGGKWLMEIAKDEDESVEIRKQAIFWAGQNDAVDLKGIVELYKNSKVRELRNQAVFTLSQRGGKAAVKTMIELARAEKDRELKKQLLFWIGQSNDPAAEEYLLEVINE